jgi:hypothetical protein
VNDGLAFSAGYLVGKLAIVGLLIWGGIALGRKLGKAKDPPRFVAWPLAVASLLALAGLLGGQQRQAAEYGASSGVEQRNG